MRTVTLDTIRDKETGETGLAVRGYSEDLNVNAATEGLLIAHDLIEHVNGVRRIGTIDDELEALGAIWYVRGQWGDLNRNGIGSAYTVHENIASDVVRMFRDFFYGAACDLNAPRTRPCEADDELLAILAVASKDAPRELDSNESEEECAKRLAPYLSAALSRMRIGYRKAKAKYEKHGRHAANNLFWVVAEAVDAIRPSKLEIGQTFKLRFGFDTEKGSTAHIFEVWEE